MKKRILLRKFPALKILIYEKARKNLVKVTHDLVLGYSDLSIPDALEFNSYLTKDDRFEKLISSVDIRNIDYFTESYFSAVEDSSECIRNTIIKMSNESDNVLVGLCNILGIGKNESRSGAIIGMGPVTWHNKKLPDYYFYNISRKEEKDFLFRKKEEISLTYSKVVGHEKRGAGIVSMIQISKNDMRNKGVSVMGPESDSSDISWLLKFLAFKELAETELEVVSLVDDSKIKPGLSRFQKEAEIDKLEDALTVNYYSANWYREIICNHEFKVSGHWRNQPYKDGYKLIFIKPFVKKGYHRKAGKDNV